MSQKSEIYQKYIERFEAQHPNIVEPEIPPTPEDVRQVTQLARSEGQPVHDSMAGKYFTILKSEFFLLPDGRVAELAQTRYGFNRAVVWPSLQAWKGYRQPMSPNVYFEQW